MGRDSNNTKGLSVFLTTSYKKAEQKAELCFDDFFLTSFVIQAQLEWSRMCVGATLLLIRIYFYKIIFNIYCLRN